MNSTKSYISMTRGALLVTAVMAVTAVSALAQSPLTPEQANAFIANATAQIGKNLGSTNGQCKKFVQDIALKSPTNITIPTTASNQFTWNGISSATTTGNVRQVSQWRASYANWRVDMVTLSPGQKRTYLAGVPNMDQQILVLYNESGKPAVRATVKNPSGTVVVPGLASLSGGALSSAFNGAGNYSVEITNTSTSASTTFIAVVLSFDRFMSDFRAARRGDIMQMYMWTSTTGSTPHTAMVLKDGNATPTNWLDSNWTAQYTVGTHDMALGVYARYLARHPTYGFTVYRLYK